MIKIKAALPALVLALSTAGMAAPVHASSSGGCPTDTISRDEIHHVNVKMTPPEVRRVTHAKWYEMSAGSNDRREETYHACQDGKRDGIAVIRYERWLNGTWHVTRTEFPPLWRMSVTNWADEGWSLTARPIRGAAPVPGGSVTFRYQIQWSAGLCVGVTCAEKRTGTKPKWHSIVIQLDEESRGSRWWQSGPRSWQKHWIYPYDRFRDEWAVGEVTVRNANGRVVEKHHAIFSG